MALFLVKVIGIFLSVVVFPGCILSYIIKNALEAEEPNVSFPLPMEQSYSKRNNKAN